MLNITATLRAPLVWVAVLLTLGAAAIQADDWPEFRGRGRLGVWNETGILEVFPDDGLAVRWRTPIHHGFSGPAVADGRVFVTDFERARGLDGTERILCLDEATGEILWTHSWEVSYAGVSWDEGPRATPTVDGDQVYAVGASGILTALKVDTGEVLWQGPGRTGRNVMFLAIPQHVVALIDNGQLKVVRASGRGFRAVATYRVAEGGTWAPPVLLDDGFLVKDKDTLTLWSLTGSRDTSGSQ